MKKGRGANIICNSTQELECEKMSEGHDVSGSDDEAVREPDTELYPLELDASDWQYLQLNGERLIWTSDLESLKNFVV